MFMQDDRIIQNFCWMPEAKWSLQKLEIKIMMNVYQIVLANTSPNYNYILGNFDVIVVKENRLLRVVCIIQIRGFPACSEVPGVGMYKV